MIQALVEAGTLDSENVKRFLYDANDGSITPRVGADLAGIVLGHVLAHRAQNDLFLQLDNRFCQVARFSGGNAKEVVCKALGALGAYARQLVKSLNKTGDGRCGRGLAWGRPVVHAVFNAGD
jgi:hypothetical protein